jgi:hypothetical protein
MSKYNRIEAINAFLKIISSKYISINRRAKIDSFLVIITDNKDYSTTCSIFIKHDHALLDQTLSSRVEVIKNIINDPDSSLYQSYGTKIFDVKNCLVIKAYAGLEKDIQRLHFRNIHKGFDSISITKLTRNETLIYKDWVTP